MTRWLLIVVMLGLVSPAWSVELKSDGSNLEEVTKAMAEAAKPGSEHQKMQPLAGNWTYTCKMWMDPNQPPMESKGTIQRKWILGNRFLEEKIVGTGVDGKSDFEGCGIMGYDNAQKKFTTGWICNMSTGISTSTGTCDASGKNFTFEKEEFCPIKQKKVKGRDEVRIESDDKVVMTMYQIDDGKEQKMMEVTSIRQK